MHSFDLNEEANFSLDKDKTIEPRDWVAYVEGVAWMLQEELGVQVGETDMAISSEVPMGAGLSSSAALEISIGMAFLSLAESEVDLVQLALAAQRAEHIYAGTKCGIMDQFTAAFGQKNARY